MGLTCSKELTAGRCGDVDFGVSHTESYIGDILNGVAAEQYPDVLPFDGEVIQS